MPSERETKKLEKEQAELDHDMNLFDQKPDRDVAISNWQHMDNIYASNELLRLLRKYHEDNQSLPIIAKD